MRICMVVEGCYPYVVGGVSSWVHSLIQLFPEHEFVILTIVANRSMRGKFVYRLPENVTEVHELYLNDDEWDKKRRRRRMDRKQFQTLRSLILNQQTDWETLFHWFQKSHVPLNSLLMGECFELILEEMEKGYDIVIGSRFVYGKKDWSLRMIGSRMITAAIKITTGVRIADPTSGMRMFSSKMIKEFVHNLNYHPESDTISHLVKNGAKVTEVPVIMDERKDGASYLNLIGSVKYMIRMLASILIFR